jgi:regulator of protease activity HflC (stomatin/prohibitin superfamily)
VESDKNCAILAVLRVHCIVNSDCNCYFVLIKGVFMKFIKSVVLAVAVALASVGCTRIETGEVGVRVNASKQIEGSELPPGSWNQTMIGSVLTFPTKDISVTLDNKTPMTADNSALADFDITVVYGLNPTSVAELYSTKSRSFHAEEKGDIFLMYSYMSTLVNNASYKVIRQYKSLEIADNRAKIEEQIRDTVHEQLKAEKLDNSVSLTVVQVRNILPNAEILQSATNYVRAQNELKIKQTEVDIAKKESERMAALSSNSGQSIAYMQAQAQMKIAEGIAAGRVNTIVVPMDFKGMVNVK